MSCHLKRGGRWWVIALVVSLLGLRGSLSFAADPAIDAKRKTAAKLIQQNKPIEALVLLTDVTDAEPNYKDLLALARLQEQVGHSGDARLAYKKVVAMTTSPRDFDERQAKTEAEKRLKALAVLGPQIDTSVETFLKKIELLEKDAVATKDGQALDRLFRLKGSIIRSEKFPTLGFCEPVPDGQFAVSGMMVKVGDKVRVITRGTWRCGKLPETECTAAGLNAKVHNGNPLGMLMATIGGQGAYAVGEESVITAQAEGPLYFYCNHPGPEKMPGGGGAVMVIARKE